MQSKLVLQTSDGEMKFVDHDALMTVQQGALQLVRSAQLPLRAKSVPRNDPEAHRDLGVATEEKPGLGEFRITFIASVRRIAHLDVAEPELALVVAIVVTDRPKELNSPCCMSEPSDGAKHIG